MADAASITAATFDPATAAILASRLQESGFPSFFATPETVRVTATDILSQLTLSTDSESEAPFLTTSQLGLRAVQTAESARSGENAGTQDPVRSQLSLDTQAFLSTLPTAVAADPTQSSLFQAHLGALGGLPQPGAGALNLAPTAPVDLTVAEAYAGAPTRAYSEGQPPQGAIAGQGATGQPGTPPAVFVALEGLASDYSPLGAPVVSLARVGTLLDLTG